MTRKKESIIGVAWMEQNGTIHLRLRGHEAGTVSETFLEFPKEHNDYAMILEHLGGLVPGEYKEVQAWPETSRHRQGNEQGPQSEISESTSLKDRT